MADCVACVISSGEIVSQLLLHCLIAYDLWVFLLRHWDYLGHAEFSQVYTGVLEENDEYETVWGAEPACILWCIWRERNQWIFEGNEMSITSLKFLFLKTLFKWATHSPTISTLSLMEFIESLLLFCKSFSFLFFLSIFQISVYFVYMLFQF